MLYPIKMATVLALRFLVNQNLLMVQYYTKLNTLLHKTELGEFPLRLGTLPIVREIPITGGRRETLFQKGIYDLLQKEPLSSPEDPDEME